jgi:membrane carboxypeptidase/penicillin-binding protein
LGGGEVKMTDLAVVYGSLANGGLRVDLAPILQVTDYRGKILFKYRCPPTNERQPAKIAQAQATEKATCTKNQVTSPQVAFILTDTLSDNNARTPAFGRHSVSNIPGHQVAVKTGTTQNLRDNWTIGYTKDLLVASWVGNNNNSPMSYVASGITGASPIWNTIMSSLLANQPPHQFQPPSSLKKVAICPATGTLSCESCPGRTEYFIPGTEPTKACIPMTNEDNQEKEQISNPEALHENIDYKRPGTRPLRRIPPQSFDSILNGI